MKLAIHQAIKHKSCTIPSIVHISPFTHSSSLFCHGTPAKNYIIYMFVSSQCPKKSALKPKGSARDRRSETSRLYNQISLIVGTASLPSEKSSPRDTCQVAVLLQARISSNYTNCFFGQLLLTINTRRQFWSALASEIACVNQA